MTRTRGPIGQDPSGGRRYGSLTSRLDPDGTIIVVEDEKDIATFFRAYFRASGQEVVHVDPTSVEDVAAAVVRLVAGAVALREVAGALTDALPSAAFVAPGEGDELGIILPATTSTSAEKALLAALGHVAAPAVVRAGVAACPEHAATLDEL